MPDYSIHLELTPYHNFRATLSWGDERIRGITYRPIYRNRREDIDQIMRNWAVRYGVPHERISYGEGVCAMTEATDAA